MAIGSLESAWNYVTGKSTPAPPPPAAPATPAVAPAQTNPSVGTLSGQTGTVSSPAASSNVTNAQGQAARLALGDIPPPEVGARYSNQTTVPHPELRPGSKETRLDDLRSISQLDENKKTVNDDQRCGASTIVAGAYYGGGTDGVKKLIDDQAAYAKNHGLKNQDPYFGDKELKKRVESGKLTNGDINKIQENLHKTLAERDIAETGNKRGLTTDRMREFMNEATNTKKVFDDNGMAIAHVDTDMKDGGNHYVLAGKHNGAPFIYDPMSIDDSNTGNLNQIVQDEGQLNIYRNSLVPSNGQKYVYSGQDIRPDRR